MAMTVIDLWTSLALRTEVATEFDRRPESAEVL
jgi:hypothetical protein